MSEKNSFEIVDGQVILHEIVDGQVILHNEFQRIDKIILNREQVAAIKPVSYTHLTLPTILLV